MQTYRGNTVDPLAKETECTQEEVLGLSLPLIFITSKYQAISTMINKYYTKYIELEIEALTCSDWARTAWWQSAG